MIPVSVSVSVLKSVTLRRFCRSGVETRRLTDKVLICSWVLFLFLGNLLVPLGDRQTRAAAVRCEITSLAVLRDSTELSEDTEPLPECKGKKPVVPCRSRVFRIQMWCNYSSDFPHLIQ